MLATQTAATEVIDPAVTVPNPDIAMAMAPQVEVSPAALPAVAAGPRTLAPEASSSTEPRPVDEPLGEAVGRAKVERARGERARTFTMLGLTALVIGAGALTSMGVAEPDRMGRVVSTAHSVMRDPDVGEGFEAGLRLAGNTVAVAAEVTLPVVGELATLATEALVEAPKGSSLLTPKVVPSHVAAARGLELATAGVFPGHLLTAGEQTLRDIPTFVAAIRAFGRIVFAHRNVKRSDLALAA